MTKIVLSLCLYILGAVSAVAFTSQTQLTVSSVIQSEALSNSTMTAPASGSVGTLSTTCSTQAVCASPTYSFSQTGSCSTAAKNNDFLLSGNSLSVNPTGVDISGGGLPPATYPVGILSSVAGTYNGSLCTTFGVVVNSGSVGPAISVNGSTTGTTVSTGGTMAVAISNGPGNAKDNIGLCNLADGCTFTEISTCIAAPYTSGTCNLPVPSVTGSYNAEFLLASAQGGTLLAQVPFTVVAGGGSVSITGVNFNSTGNAAITVSQGLSGTVDALTTTCSAACPGVASYSTASTGGAPTLSGISLSNSSFTCGTGGTVGQLTIGGSGNIAAATLALDSTSLSRGFSLSSTTSPSNLLVTSGISCPTNPTTYSVSVTATLAGATGSPLTPPAFTISGSQVNNIPQISVTPSLVSPGGSTTFTVSGGPLTGQTVSSWVGVCSSSTDPTTCAFGVPYPPGSWKYINSCSQTVGLAIVASASCTINAPASSGSYHVNWFPVDDNVTAATVSTPLTVSSGFGSTCTPASSPCPSGVAAPPGYHWNMVFDDEFTNDSSLNTSLWVQQCPVDAACGSLSFNPTTGISIQAALTVPTTSFIRVAENDNGGTGGFRFGYFELSAQLPHDASGEGDGYHPDLHFRTPTVSTDGEFDMCEKVLGTDGNQKTCDTFVVAPIGAGSPVDNYTLWNSYSSSTIDTAFHTYGNWWNNNAGSNGSISIYFDGSLAWGPYTLQSSTWGGELMGFRLYEGACQNPWNNGNYCGSQTSPNNPLMVRYARIWQLAPN